jgi:hypothetical protein
LAEADARLAKSFRQLLSLKPLLFALSVELAPNAFCAGFFAPLLARLVEVTNPPRFRFRHLFEDPSRLYWSSFLDFGGRPAPDSFGHLRNFF